VREAAHSLPSSAEFLYLQSPIFLHGMVLNYLNRGTNLPFTFPKSECYITTQSTQDVPAQTEVCCVGTRLWARVPMSYSHSAQDGEAKAQMLFACGLQDAWLRGVQPPCNL
jgi:hypothetical protein